MRIVKKLQLELGETAIENIKFDPKSRDDIPALLIGLQHIYSDPATRKKLFSILEEKFSPEVNLKVGRPGMDIWRVVVLGVLKQGLGCDFDRLCSLANSYKELRQMLGHSDYEEQYLYDMRRIVDNVSLLTPELLNEIGKLVVSSGHKVAKKKPGDKLRARCDSFVVETNVHYPTDINLLYDATRCMVRVTAHAAEEYDTGEWRKLKDHLKKLRSSYNSVRGRRKGDERAKRVKDYLSLCRGLLKKCEKTLSVLMVGGGDVGLQAAISSIEHYRGHTIRQIDQVRRRILNGEVIPQEEKVFSVFEEHTRWISKGKAGKPVELGVPVSVMEDQHRFVLGYKIMWKEHDVDVPVDMVKDVKREYQDLSSCSFDKGFWSKGNRKALDELLESNVLPKKGKLNAVEREREEGEEFVRMRRRHPGIESAINALEHKGLDRIRSRGKRGFARMVALSMLAANLHRLGSMIKKERKKKEEKLKRQRKAA